MTTNIDKGVLLLESPTAWNRLKKGMVSDIKGASRRRITESVLENVRRQFLAEHATQGSTVAANVAIINKVMMPLIKRIMPTVMAHELVGVQPLSGPSGTITTMRIRYATNSPVDGSGIIAGQEALSPFLVGAWYSGNEDMVNPGAADTAVLEGTGGNDINIEFVKEDVKAGSRKLKARFTLEAMQDAQSQYGANIEQELTSALAQEIVLDIDQEILGKLLNAEEECKINFVLHFDSIDELSNNSRSALYEDPFRIKDFIIIPTVPELNDEISFAEIIYTLGQLGLREYSETYEEKDSNCKTENDKNRMRDSFKQLILVDERKPTVYIPYEEH